MADTNFLIHLLANDKTAKNRALHFPVIYIPSVAFGELAYGAWNSAQRHQNLATIEDLHRRLPTLDVNYETALMYGRVRSELKSDGRPIPLNDVWIAALAIQYGLPLLTRDSHFSHVADLKTETW